MIGFLNQYWVEIVLGAIVLGFIAYVLYLIYNKRMDKVEEWLLYAVLEAERFFGSGTGKIKLRYVYDKFVHRYPVLKMFISFERFSNMVDVALKEVEEFIKSK